MKASLAIDWDRAVAIREYYAQNPKLSKTVIGAHFGVSYRTVYRYLDAKYWAEFEQRHDQLEKDYNAIVKDYLSNMPIKDIAVKHNIPKNTVYRILSPIRKSRKVTSEGAIQKICEYASAHSAIKAAQHFGVSRSFVYRRLKQNS